VLAEALNESASNKKGHPEKIMKTITSATLALSLTLTVAGLSFAQTPAAQTPASHAAAKDNTMATAPVKKHVKKHSNKKAVDATAKPAAPAATPSK
jgi:hypothetical protein